MGKTFILLFVVSVFSLCAQANVLVNPGFEDGPTGQLSGTPIPGWNVWGWSGWHHNDAGRIIDTKAVKLWWTDSGIWQDFAAVSGHTYRCSGHMLHHTTDPLRNGDKSGQLQIEWYDNIGLMLREDTIGIITMDDPTNIWLHYSADLVTPESAISGRFLIRMYQPTAGDGAVNYDNMSVYDLDKHGLAYAPAPADHANVTLDLAQLSWLNNPAKNPEDVLTCTVYLEAEGPVIDPNFYTAPIATGVTGGMVNLTAAGVTLVDNTVYTWRVDTTDPNTGGEPVTFQGNVWTFQIGDVAPLVNAGSNRYVWLIDGEGHFTLSGSYIDDARSPIVRAEYIQGNHEKAGATIVTMGTQIHDPVAKTVTVDVVVSNPVPDQMATGWYRFTLEVEDGSGIGSGAVNAGVYGTCLEAALADPADTKIASTWPNGHGDINGDCKTDLEDFALLASSWVECMTAKAGCTP